MKKIIDYNGDGRWSQVALTKLYMELCKKSKIVPLNLKPIISENDSTMWIYPIMDEIIDAAKLGDLPSIEIVLQLMECDDSMPFGMTLKCRGSRALKIQAHLLNSDQIKRIKQRVVNMDSRGYTPREFYEYSRLYRLLLRKENEDLKC